MMQFVQTKVDERMLCLRRLQKVCDNTWTSGQQNLDFWCSVVSEDGDGTDTQLELRGQFTELKATSHEQFTSVSDRLKSYTQLLDRIQKLEVCSRAFLSQLRMAVHECSTPLFIAVRPTMNSFSFNAPPTAHLADSRIGTVREVLLECCDDVHRVFIPDLVGMVMEYVIVSDVKSILGAVSNLPSENILDALVMRSTPLSILLTTNQDIFNITKDVNLTSIRVVGLTANLTITLPASMTCSANTINISVGDLGGNTLTILRVDVMDHITVLGAPGDYQSVSTTTNDEYVQISSVGADTWLFRPDTVADWTTVTSF